MSGIEKTNSNFKIKNFTFEILKDSENNMLKLFSSIIIIIIIFLPTFIFRYSLKSTAWIYLPLIWLIQPQD